jgi:hypothetical protein
MEPEVDKVGREIRDQDEYRESQNEFPYDRDNPSITEFTAENRLAAFFTHKPSFSYNRFSIISN